MSTSPATGRLTFTTTTCFVVRCFDCATPFGYDGEIHFFTLEAARRDLESTGWSRAHDAESPGRDVPADAERWRCRDCATARICAAVGHQPSPMASWFDRRTGVSFQDGQVCERCNIYLAKPVRKLSPADYPIEDTLIRYLHWDHASLPEGADLTAAVAVLIDQANALGWLTRWDAYLAAHPDAVRHDRDDTLDIAAGITAADQLITLVGKLRQQLTQAVIPAAAPHMVTTNPDA
ncbi:hypothetical protein [Streptosporangium saharense]|uniref:Uncharacterized protein n=1 Tax=Streptosporangium saharense TaxID=1706840 RepID=A0A7W7QPJ2_9ACTN|nr:hypothetical protein [Streptosporangium saharense]MBB4917409.1 hypothetical protein [Streptosporangium saharense]